MPGFSISNSLIDNLGGGGNKIDQDHVCKYDKNSILYTISKETG